MSEYKKRTLLDIPVLFITNVIGEQESEKYILASIGGISYLFYEDDCIAIKEESGDEQIFLDKIMCTSIYEGLLVFLGITENDYRKNLVNGVYTLVDLSNSGCDLRLKG